MIKAELLGDFTIGVVTEFNTTKVVQSEPLTILDLHSSFFRSRPEMIRHKYGRGQRDATTARRARELYTQSPRIAAQEQMLSAILDSDSRRESHLELGRIVFSNVGVVEVQDDVNRSDLYGPRSKQKSEPFLDEWESDGPRVGPSRWLEGSVTKHQGIPGGH